MDTTPVTLDNQYAQQPGLYPDLSTLYENGSLQAAASIPVQQDIQISPGQLYPSLEGLQAETAAPPSLNGNYQLDLIQQLTSGEFQQYAAGSSNLDHLHHQQGISHQQSQTIEDLLDLAEQDAREANEAIMHLQEEEEREQKLDDELLEELEREEREGSDAEMQEDAEMDEDIAIPSDEEGEEGLFEDEQHNGPALRLPPSKQKSTSRETSDIISIGSTSDEEEESAEIDDEEEEEGEEEDEEPIDLDAEEDVNDEEEEESDLEVTPPPISASQTASSQAPVIPVSGPSRQLFGQLDAPIPSQSRLMSQKIRRRMDEDDLRTSGFDEEEEGMRSGSSDASDEHAREWQQFRRKAGKGQRAQDEQDAADRYFNDEDEDEAYPRDSENEEEDEDEEESDEDALSEEDYATRIFRKLSKRAAQGEFEDEIDDETIADQERQVKRSKADLDERVPVPAFMKLDKETGEYELRTGTSSEEDEEEESEEEEEGEEQQVKLVSEVCQGDEDIKIEVLAEEDITVEFEGDTAVEAQEGFIVERSVTTELEGEIDQILDEVAGEDGSQAAIPDEIVDLVHSDTDASADIPQPFAATSMNISEMIAHSMKEDQTSIAGMEALPPLPQALADVADQLIDETVEAISSEEPGHTEAAQKAGATMAQALAAPESSQRSGESSLPPARTPRKSAEPRLFSSIAVSPEQFSLSPRPAREPSVTPAVPPVSRTAADSTAQALQPETATAEAIEAAEAPAPSLLDELPTSFGDKTGSLAPAKSEEEMTLEDEANTVVRAEASAPGEEWKHQPTHFTEDHHHEPPPPELQEERHFTSEQAGTNANDQMAGIDLTTDEMEAHSADEAEQIAEGASERHFAEDHHFEPPPPELLLEGETETVEEILDKEEPLTGVDMTTDEMEEHSAGEEADKPVHEIGYKEEHTFEPPLLPSEQKQETPKITKAVVTPLDEPVDTTIAAGQDLPADVASEAAQSEASASQSVPEVGSEKAEEVSLATASEKPIVSPQQQKATPSRKFNAIKPGLWDPSTPIRFGGTSLEAAIREAYYDPERSANLKKTLEIEDDDDASTSADKSKVDDGSISTISAGKASRHVDFVPLDDDAEMEEAGDEPADENDAVAPEVIPARISSPGIKGDDGDLTETVLEADFVRVPSTLHSCSELYRLR